MTEIPRLVQEAQLAIQLVDRAAHTAKYGSFSQRNPTLGRMIRCEFCRKKRRQNAEIPCCNGRKIEPPQKTNQNR